MFLDDYEKINTQIKKVCSQSGTFSAGFRYWRNVLFERVMRLFVWEGTESDDKKMNIEPRELELILMTNGSAGVHKKYKNTLAAYSGNYCGSPTLYYDVYEDYAYYSPLTSGILKVDKDIVVIRNNAVMNSILPLVNRYATMLAHTEVSFVNTLINGRDSGGIPIASTTTQKAAIEQYRDSLCNGKVGSILDPAFSGVKFLSVDKNTTLNIRDLIEVRQNLLDAFYNDIGVRTSFNKKGNMIVEEVEANDPMLLLNINDMLNERKKGCEKINKLFGTNWSVDIAEELRYNEDEEEVKTNEVDNNQTVVEAEPGETE